MVIENEIKAECVRNGITVTAMANQMGMNGSTAYRKLRGISDFTLGEIKSMQHILNLSNERIVAIFFADSLANTQVKN